MMATQNVGGARVSPKADQPRVSTDTLRKQTSGPGLTQRTTGVKNSSGGRTQRNYART